MVTYKNGSISLISCYKTVQTNSKQLVCEQCKLLVHLNCANVILKTVELSRVHFKRITPISPRCDTYEQKKVAVDNYLNIHDTKLQELKTHISICHLNT